MLPARRMAAAQRGLPLAHRRDGAGPVLTPLRLRPGLEGLIARAGRGLHLAVILLGIFVYTGAKLVQPAGGNDETLGAFDPFNTAFQLVILLGGGLASLLHWRRSLAFALRAWPFLLLVGMLVASAGWSQSPEHTLRRCISMIALLLWVFSACAAFGVPRVMRAIVVMVIVIAIASLGLAIVNPAAGYDVGDYANAIRGVFPQKNALGMALLSGALAQSFLALERGHLRWTDGAFLLGLLVMLVLCRSTTSLLLTMTTAGVTVVILWLDRGGAWFAAMLLGLGVAAASGGLLFGVLGKEGLFELIGKDASLTGRTFIWEGVDAAVSLRPLLGYGYSAFWIAGTAGVRAIWEAIQWETPTAHSGYLEVLLQVGWVGAGVLLLVLLTTLWRIGLALARGVRRRAGWMILYIGVLAVLSYSESALLGPDLQTVFWMLGFLAIAVGLPAAPPPAAPPRHEPRIWQRAGAGPMRPAAIGPGAALPSPIRR